MGKCFYLISLLLIQVWCAVAYASTQQSLTVEYFDFYAKDIKQAIAEIKKNGPKSGQLDTWGMLYTDIDTHYTLRSNDTQCYVKPQKIEVIGEMHIPRWLNVENTSQTTQRWWQAFSKFVKQHEINHFDLAKSVAQSYFQSLHQMTPAQNCATAKNQYYRLKRNMQREIVRQDDLLDQRTQKTFLQQKTISQPIIEALGTNATIESGMMRNIVVF